jgi:hypothetical protein
MKSQKDFKDITEAAAAIRQHGEPVEVYWSTEGKPHSSGSWSGELVGIDDLRRWMRSNIYGKQDICLYCAGEFIEVTIGTE